MPLKDWWSSVHDDNCTTACVDFDDDDDDDGGDGDGGSGNMTSLIYTENSGYRFINSSIKHSSVRVCTTGSSTSIASSASTSSATSGSGLFFKRANFSKLSNLSKMLSKDSNKKRVQVQESSSMGGFGTFNSGDEAELVVQLEAQNRALTLDQKMTSFSVPDGKPKPTRPAPSLPHSCSKDTSNRNSNNNTDHDDHHHDEEEEMLNLEDPVSSSTAISKVDAGSYVSTPVASGNGNTPSLCQTCEYQQPNEESWKLWGGIISDWEGFQRRLGSGRLLRRAICDGIPNPVRGMVWQLMCKTDPGRKDLYLELLQQTSPCEKQISRDIARTFPTHAFFAVPNGPGQEALFNVIKAYSLFDREVGYCQGSPFVVGLLLMQMPEEDAFCVFVQLMNQYNLRDLYKPSMSALEIVLFQLDALICETLPAVYRHFTSFGVIPTMYAPNWFLTMFASTSLSLDCVFRIMDVILLEGVDFIFQVSLSLLSAAEEEILCLDFEGLMIFLKTTMYEKYGSNADTLIRSADMMKVGKRRLRALMKKYIANKERESELQHAMEAEAEEEKKDIIQLKRKNEVIEIRLEELDRENQELLTKCIRVQKLLSEKDDEIFKLSSALEERNRSESLAVLENNKLRERITLLMNLIDYDNAESDRVSATSYDILSLPSVTNVDNDDTG